MNEIIEEIIEELERQKQKNEAGFHYQGVLTVSLAVVDDDESTLEDFLEDIR